jgi:hypothetical protein
MTWKQTINKWQFLLSVVAFVILFVSLYQLEIIYINILNKQPFCLPFYVICSWDWAFWRDVFYAGIILAFFLLLYSIWKWE